MGRQPCCDKVGLKRGPWTIEEDQKLMDFILNNGVQCWRLLPKLAGLPRCGKSCRLRWMNYLRPDLKRGALSEAEEDQIIELHSRLGNRWSKIAAHFPGRTDNEIKNQWNTRIKKKLKLLGLDPVTHKPLDQQGDEKEKEIAPTSEGLKETDDSSSGKSTNLLPTKESLSQEVDARSSLTLQSDHSCSSSRINESVLREDQSQQYWIENMDSLLSWDGFGSLEDLFILDNHQ